MAKRIVYFDMDGVLCKFKKKYDEELKRNHSIKYPQATYGFFTSLEPHHIMIGLYKALEKNSNFEVHILTAPSIHNPLCYTEKRVWVEKHLGMDAVQRMVITQHKNLLKGDYLIDDHSTGRGQDKFEGKLLLVDEDNMNETVNNIINTIKDEVVDIL
ncbi:MAG: hypothetical protein GY827_04875 [Cytophagales bacterium]|nr:hypothetical protein [Cytophagales bacterium]